MDEIYKQTDEAASSSGDRVCRLSLALGSSRHCCSRRSTSQPNCATYLPSGAMATLPPSAAVSLSLSLSLSCISNVIDDDDDTISTSALKLVAKPA